MLYISTRGSDEKLISAEAIVKGLSDDGGLYVPEYFPRITLDIINMLTTKTYSQRASYILSAYMGDFSTEEIEDFANRAYNIDAFSDPAIAPLHTLDDSTYFLELWHGPTSAFKDYALQIMPSLLTASLRKINENREVCILVATSGDTGKAALEGFRDVPGTRIMVFYPRDGVSEVQKLQMTSQQGSNVNVVAVDGNFDDTQTGVKEIFSDELLREKLSEQGFFLSSANSINWGRLVPQIAYYVSAYCDLLDQSRITLGEKINFCVPTGNFGNILAAYYAHKMGLPIGKLILASNRNDVLADFVKTGIYDRNRQFHLTVSPSMDILVSSNLERLLFELSGKDGEMITGLMTALSQEGKYEIPLAMKAELDRIFVAGSCSEEDTLETIARTFSENAYLIDTHTAVAYKVLREYRENTGDNTNCVVVSTASPFKFCESVLFALGKSVQGEGPELIDILSEHTDIGVPKPLQGLLEKTPRFIESISAERMQSSVREFLRS